MPLTSESLRPGHTDPPPEPEPELEEAKAFTEYAWMVSVAGYDGTAGQAVHVNLALALEEAREHLSALSCAVMIVPVEKH